MHRFALALTVTLLFHLSTNAQNNTSSNDASAVRTTVTHYIEGYFSGDAQRMEQTLHPHYLKHVIHAAIPMREMTGPELIKGVRQEGKPDLAAADKSEQVTVLDVAEDIASAKLVTPGWTDYMTLSKVNGEWKILSVVQRIDE
ncbi:MAG TPA: nuclear transport factor 2 family protein [Terriglobales bacterium]|jgi:Putative lumazine-binding|nr:nuclear transport factor 2 family protein [Terriglobales bacterium]